MQKHKEADRRVYGRLAELFEIKPQSYVVRSQTKSNTSKVGSVRLGEDSVIAIAVCGPDGIFIDNKTPDEFFSIPWKRIDAIDRLSEKRISLRVNDPAGRSTDIVIPWSKDMTLEGWTRYCEKNE